jgi:GNAT superfamily N-acetyltransferase
MTAAAIARFDEETVESAISVITLAFSADPIARWAFPDADVYYKYFPPFTRAFAGGAFEAGSALVTEDNAGAALWLPPGVHPDDEAIGAIVEESVREPRLSALMAFVQRQSALHPTETHWYLPMMGVDPAHQRKGHGSRLLQRALMVCDRERLPAYLEATTPSSRALYERHGFVAVNQVQAGDSPTMWGMMRQARLR